MEKINKAIEILNAFKEGKTIEWYDGFSRKWLVVKDITKMSLFEDNIRVKPQPTYRPYANAEEFLKASKEHGPYLKCLQNVYYIPYNVNITVSIHAAKNVWTYKELLENDFKWSDDSVCGILEQ